MTHYRNDMKRKIPFYKTLNRIGGTLIFIGILMTLKYKIFGIACVILGALFIIPDYWLFFLKQKEKGKGWDSYWFVQFSGLIIMLVLLICGFIIVLREQISSP